MVKHYQVSLDERVEIACQRLLATFRVRHCDLGTKVAQPRSRYGLGLLGEVEYKLSLTNVRSGLRVAELLIDVSTKATSPGGSLRCLDREMSAPWSLRLADHDRRWTSPA
jgi:hypothetical protein